MLTMLLDGHILILLNRVLSKYGDPIHQTRAFVLPLNLSTSALRQHRLRLFYYLQ